MNETIPYLPGLSPVAGKDVHVAGTTGAAFDVAEPIEHEQRVIAGAADAPVAPGRATSLSSPPLRATR